MKSITISMEAPKIPFRPTQCPNCKNYEDKRCTAYTERRQLLGSSTVTLGAVFEGEAKEPCPRYESKNSNESNGNWKPANPTTFRTCQKCGQLVNAAELSCPNCGKIYWSPIGATGCISTLLFAIGAMATHFAFTSRSMLWIVIAIVFDLLIGSIGYAMILGLYRQIKNSRSNLVPKSEKVSAHSPLSTPSGSSQQDLAEALQTAKYAETGPLRTKDPDEAASILFERVLPAIPDASSERVQQWYDTVKDAWSSRKLIKGSRAQVKSVVLANLRRIRSEPNFDEFVVKVYLAEVAQVEAYTPTHFIPVRVWRSENIYYACGNSDFC
jgi:hypothetical protein